MYRQSIKPRDRALTLGAVLLAHAGLAFVLLNMTGTIEMVDREDLTQLINIAADPPEPEPEVELQPQDAAPEEEGAASAKNIESEATPVEAPKPRVETPTPNPIVASSTPREGRDATQGASDVVGPGTGAGGVGDGTGAGRGGDGTGGGGRGSGVRLIQGITNRDYPREIQRAWPRGGRIFVRIRVLASGQISQCDVMRSFGDRNADQWTCSLLMRRGRFQPATDARGRPIDAWFGYIQSDTGRFDR